MFYISVENDIVVYAGIKHGACQSCMVEVLITMHVFLICLSMITSLQIEYVRYRPTNT